MAISQLKAKKKVSGGRYKTSRKKKYRDLGRLPTLTKVGKKKVRKIRVTGGKIKKLLLGVEFANVYDPKAKKYSKLKIEGVVDNPANRHYIRRSIVTKGTIIKTEKGNARVLSRPGQEDTVNAVLV